MYRLVDNRFMRTTWRVERALSLETPEQRSEEWFEARRNKITGSLVDTILGSNPYQTRESMVLIKAGKPEIFTGNAATAHGCKYEDIAVAKYAQLYNRVVFHCGLIPHPTHPLLAHSPDGLSLAADGVGEPVLLEVKCPLTRKIKPGFVPPYYRGQIQMGMDLFGLTKCHFVQYRPPNPETNEEEILQLTVVDADPNWLAKNDPELRRFWSEVEYWRAQGWQNHPSLQCLIPDE